MHQLIRARPLATLVTLTSGGLNANHIPLHLVADHTRLGILQGHVARANPIWSDLTENVESLAIFHGPESYISPSWYATKKQTGKVVPTWNYAVVHAYGSLRIIDDAAWLRGHLEVLTTQHEAKFSEPWAVSDGPKEFIDRLMGSVVGIELVVTRMTGKWKTSQNQPPENRRGIVDGLRAAWRDEALAMATLVETSPPK